MATLELRFLGGLRIIQDGQLLLELKSRKGQALLCYLAVTHKRFSRSALAGLFWPDMPETEALMNLRKVLNRVKPVFPLLAISRETLAFNQEAPYWLDVEEFETGVVARTDIRRLQVACSLYQGDFLDGFECDDFPLFYPWVVSQRARLREAALNGLQTLITYFPDRQNYPDAIQYARQLLTIEPWQEETHRDLMRLLALTGQRSAALVQYETCSRLLAEELGVEPAPATVHLYEQIKAGELEGMKDGETYLLPLQPAAPLQNLPVQTTPFVGRDLELSTLEKYLSDPNVRLITILGPGGMGKTRLALAAAEAQVDGQEPSSLFPQGVFFVSLARLETPDQLIPAIAEAVNFRFVENEEPKEQLLRFLRQKTMLLVLDNFEHLRSRASLLDEILSTAAGIKMLVTSREKLNLQAEQLFPIGGMVFPAGSGAANGEVRKPLTDYSAIQLFCERAQRVHSGFALTPANQLYVVDICRLVQGMPLGIVLASAWLEMLSPQEIVAEMRQNLNFLETTMGDVPERQRSLRAAFNHSWRMLPDPERDVFQQLSIFRGGFTRHASQTITGASLHDLQGLVNKSLLMVTPGGRYEIHELLRQFAAEKLAQAVEIADGVRDRHSAYYCNFLHDHTENWHTARQLETLTAISREADNVQAAWHWALERGEWLRLAQAVDSLGWYYEWHGRIAEGASAFQEIVDKADALASQKEAASPVIYRLWAKALAWQGKFAMNNHDALQRIQDGLGLIERLELAHQEIRQEKAFLLHEMGIQFYSLDRQKSRQLVEQSLALYQATGDSWGIANDLIVLGKLDWGTGHYALAQERILAGLALQKSRGDVRAQIAPLTNLAWIQQHLGHLEEAERLRREVLSLCQQLGDRSSLSTYTANLSYTLRWQGKFEENLYWAERSLSICLEDGRRDSEGYARLAISFPLLFTGQYERARQEATRALSAIRETNDRGVEATVHWALGCLALAAQSYDDAQVAFIQSHTLYHEVQDNYLGLSLAGLGFAACYQRGFSRARQHFVEALQYALDLKDFIHLIVALPGVALLQAMTGKIEQAVEIWELAKCHPFIAHSRWHADIVGQHVETATATLPAEIANAARERGRTLDLWQTAQALLRKLG